MNNPSQGLLRRVGWFVGDGDGKLAKKKFLGATKNSYFLKREK